ncbi:MAG: toxin [Vicinamibacteria bacterium]|nr:toxin [Vicinamibacteria bacterium]
MEFIEAPAFTQLLPEYLTDDEYAELQQHLARDPEAGDVIPGTGGFRRVRWGDARRGRGRRGGLRVIYYLFHQPDLIWLVTLYGKSEVADLTPNERRLLKAAADEEKRRRSGPRRK